MPSKGKNEIEILIPDSFSRIDANEVLKAINEGLALGYRCCVLDFSQCQDIDSTGLGILAQAYKTCQEQRTKLRLANVHYAKIREILTITQIDKFIPIE